MSAPIMSRAVARLPGLCASFLAASLAHAAVGRTPGQFMVSPTGSAQYQIPIWTPPGAGGMKPDLSIFYSHDRDNGILGIGFDISGFSAITRCAKTIIWDTVDAPVQMQTSDALCLDGTRILLTSGTQGTAGSEYRTSVETFSRIKAHSGGSCSPIYFEVYRRDGMILQYGNSTDSCIDFGSGSGREWALTSIRDRSGNTTTFKYTEDNTNGSYRPDEITYATNSNAALYTAPYKVKFVYDGTNRSDPIRTFWPAGGGGRDELKRLQRLEVQHSASVKKMYLFEYTTSATSGRSRLWKVKECSTVDTDRLDPTVFEYTTATAGLLSEQNPSQNVYGLQMIDVSGDGRDDMVYSNHTTSGSGQWRIRLANSSGGYDSEIVTGITNTNYATALPINWDGDRYIDLLSAHSGGTWHVLRWNGSNFATPLNTSVSSSADYNTMDLNGDQLDDLVKADHSSGAAVYVRYNQGGSFGNETFLWSTNNANVYFLQTWPLRYQRHRSAQRRSDFNGDGKEEWICWIQEYFPDWETYYTTIALCNAGGYTPIEGSDGSYDLGGSHMYGDINDDGLTDVVWATNSNFKVLFGGATSITTGPSSASLYQFSFVTADYDGDGRDDVLAQSTTSPYTLYYLRSTGNGLAAAATASVTYPAATIFKAAEINGDDRTDFVSISGVAVKYRLHQPPYDLMSSATDGFGVAAAFTYAPMTDSTVYTVGSGSVYPWREVQFATQLVKQVTATDQSGTTGTYTLTYSYSAARSHATGYGYLGFEKRTTVDSRNSLKLEETYSQLYPSIGKLKISTLKQSNGNVIRQTTNDWWLLQTLGGAWYPYIYNSVTTDRELDNTHFRTVSWTMPGNKGASGLNSTWGVVTDVTTTTTEVATGDWTTHTKTERIAVTDLHVDSTNWCVRPKTTELTNDLSIGSIPSQTRTMERTWDSACRVSRVRLEPGSTTLEVDTQYEFDAFGNVDEETVTGAGMTARVTETDWDSSKGQFPETITNALGHVVSFDYDYGLGLLTTVVDPNSEVSTPIVTSWTYDAFGRKQTETDPDLTDTQWAFASCTTSDSRVKYAVDVKLRQTNDTVMRTDNVCFDRFNRPILGHLQLADGGAYYVTSVQKVQYDSLGRVSRQDNPFDFGGSANGYWSFSYDIFDRLTAETLYTAAGSFNRDRTYAYAGLTTTIQDFRDNSTTGVVTAWGDLARMRNATSTDTTYEFDAFSQLTKVSDTVSALQTHTYNIRGMRLTSADNDMGGWTFEHNALGELLRVRDAKTTAPNWTTEYMNLDALGRPTKRREAEGDTDYTWGNSATSNNIGRLASVAGPNYSETLSYDVKARLTGQSITISGDTTHAIDYGYHSDTGFLDTLTFPTSTSSYRFKLQYEYAYGALTKVKRFDSPYTAYWTLSGTDPRGNAQLETLGNSVSIESTYDQLTGFLSSRVSNTGSLMNLAYQWDANGNLTQRQDVRRSLTEAFTYDTLDRVVSSTLGGSSNLSVSYDYYGNITAKDGQSYNYGTAQSGCDYYSHSQRHAVRKVGTTVYCYDENGNMEKRGATTISWTPFNLPNSISSGTPSSQFWYGPGRERIKQVGNYSGGSETTYYVGGILEKMVSSAGITRFRHRIESPTGLVAIYERPSTGSEETFYFTKDHLGSVDSVTDAAGNVEVRLAYDAFGGRRDESDWSGSPPSADWTAIAGTTRRGYTEHEHLDNLGLVHMNGRVHDPAIGRFLSADPFVTDPLSRQSFNRFSYVMNNPLALVDPSGFDWWQHNNEDRRHGDLSDLDLETVLWVRDGIGPQIYEPQSNEEIGFTQRSTSTPTPTSEEPAPEGSSVDCSAKPCINYSIAEDGGGVRRPPTISESLETSRAHIRELQESLEQTKEMYARFEAERQALAAKNAARLERDWSRVKWVVSWTPWGRGVKGGQWVLAGFGGKAAARGSAGTLKGLGNIGSHGVIDAGKALGAGQKWLGAGYKEIAPGVFRSADGLRQFRMTNADILGSHGKIGSHVHFEALNDAGKVIENLHLPVTP